MSTNPIARAVLPRRRFGIVAGEPSGDLLGASLMQAISARAPGATFVGVGGAQMQAAGLATLAPLADLSVNGLVDPLLRLPTLLRVLRQVRDAVRAAGVDAFIGIDFNVFNLLLARLLRRHGIYTVHYVSPSVYAWRRGRIDGMRHSTDLMLTLFPFEPPLYAGRGVDAVFVGHPLADEIEQCDDPWPARRRLGIDGDPLIAVLPGSRRREIEQLAPTFLHAARLLARRLPGARFAIPCVHAAARARLEVLLGRCPEAGVTLVDGQARAVLEACDAALVKSGTGTLEAMLVGRPMVIAYRLDALTFQVLRKLLRVPSVGLPNILAGRVLVPELLQDAATPEALAEALEGIVTAADPALLATFATLARSLRRGAAAQAAEAILARIGARPSRDRPSR